MINEFVLATASLVGLLMAWSFLVVEVASQDAVTSPQVASMAYSAMGALLVLASRAQSTVLTSALMRASHVTKVVNTINDESRVTQVAPQNRKHTALMGFGERRRDFLNLTI